MVATSSTAGLKGVPFLAPYVASKHGVVGIVRSMALELAKHNIRVNSVHPTGLDTAMMRYMGGMEAMFDKDPEMAPLFQNLLPTELIEMDDVSQAILYLVSDTGRFVTGVQLPVDAGFTTR
jgi:NAD(P)-dependent dehydrogenase (short-subunit alcohol dehydrogenase family)